MPDDVSPAPDEDKIWAVTAAVVGDPDRDPRAHPNEQRPHQGRWCYGKTPMQTFLDTVPVAKDKLLVA
jgi:hypothetical protein